MKYKDWNLKDLDSVEKNGLRVFSCFACGGGSSMGYKLAGYDVQGINEIDPEMTEMYHANFPKAGIIHMPIQQLVKEKCYKDYMFNLDVLDGSPPCSNFSMAGNRESDWGKDKKFREGQAKQVLDDLFFSFIALAKDLQPKVVISENVKGMLVGKAKGYVSKIIREFDEAGYDTQIFLLNAASMGIPQKRERVFFISRRKDLNLPKVTMAFNEPTIMFEDIKGLGGGLSRKETDTEKAILNAALPKDKSVATVNERVFGKTSGFTMHITRDKQVPNTLSSGGAMYSLSEKRHLTTGELRMIQSFPADYNFIKNYSYSHIKYVLGMSVPPLMMYGVAKTVRDQLFKR